MVVAIILCHWFHRCRCICQNSSTVFDINNSNIFFGSVSPKTNEIKAKINKWELAFAQQKKSSAKMKRQPSEWEKISADDI